MPSQEERDGNWPEAVRRDIVDREGFDQGMYKTRVSEFLTELEQRKEERKNAKTPYVSIDIETTGVEDWCQTIEIGAIVDDWITPVDQLPRWHCYVVHDRYVGEPYALSMHPTIFRRIAERNKDENKQYLFLSPAQIAPELRGWLMGQGFDDPIERAFTPAGKNFSGFDRQFLKRLPDFDKIKMHHRAIDPGNLFWNPDTDKVLPDSKECKKRAGVGGEVAHTALDDALDVIQEVRYWNAQRPAWTDRDLGRGFIAAVLDKARENRPIPQPESLAQPANP